MTVATLQRYQPLVVRALRDVLSVAGVILLLMTMRNDGPGYDFYAYWSVDPADPYAVKEGFGAFHYTPPMVWLAGPLRFVTWPLAYWLWFGLLLVVLVWLARDWALAWLSFPPVVSELYHGNVHLLIAAALVLSLRRPAVFPFLVLTKVSPAVSALWWLARREWRPLAVALGSAATIVGIAVALQADTWAAWLAHVSSEANHAPNLFPVPVLLRLPVAVLLVALAAWRGARWLLAPAVVLALPLLWIHGLAILVAATPLLRMDRAADPSTVIGHSFSLWAARERD